MSLDGIPFQLAVYIHLRMCFWFYQGQSVSAACFISKPLPPPPPLLRHPGSTLEFGHTWSVSNHLEKWQGSWIFFWSDQSCFLTPCGLSNPGLEGRREGVQFFMMGPQAHLVLDATPIPNSTWEPLWNVEYLHCLCDPQSDTVIQWCHFSACIFVCILFVLILIIHMLGY